MKTRVVAISVHGGILVVQARLNDTFVAYLAVDPGAAKCMLTDRFLARNPQLSQKPMERSISAGAAGHTTPILSELFVVHSVAVELIERRDIELIAMTLPRQARIDGVLGVNFLRPYRVTFDFIEEWLEFDDRS